MRPYFIILFLLISTTLFCQEGFKVIYTAEEKMGSNKMFSMEYNSKTEEYIFHFGDVVVRKNFDSDDWQEQLESLQNSIEISFKDAKAVHKEVFGRIRLNMLKGHNFNAPDIKIMAKSWEETLMFLNRGIVTQEDCERVKAIQTQLSWDEGKDIEFWKAPSFVELRLLANQEKDLVTALMEKALAKEGFVPADSLFDFNLGKMEKKDDPLGNPHKSTEELLKEWMERKNNEREDNLDSAPLKIGIAKRFNLDRVTTIDFKQESMAINGTAGQSYLIGDRSYHSFLRKVGDDYKEFLSVDRVEMEVLHEMTSNQIFLRVNGAVSYLSNESGLGKVIYENWQRFELRGDTVDNNGTGPKRNEVDVNLQTKIEQDIHEQVFKRLDLLARYEVGINLNNDWKQGSYVAARVEVGAEMRTFQEGGYRGSIGGKIYMSHDQFLDNDNTETIGVEVTGRIYQKNNQVLLIVLGANDNLNQAEQDKGVFGEVNSYFGMRSSLKF